MHACDRCKDLARGVARIERVAGNQNAIEVLFLEMRALPDYPGPPGQTCLAFQSAIADMAGFSDEGVMGLQKLVAINGRPAVGQNVHYLFNKATWVSGRTTAETSEAYLTLLSQVYGTGQPPTGLYRCVQSLGQPGIKGSWMTMDVSRNLFGGLANLEQFEEMTAAGKQGMDIVLKQVNNGARWIEVKATAGAYDGVQALEHLEGLAQQSRNWDEFRMVINYFGEGDATKQAAKMKSQATDLLQRMLDKNPRSATLTAIIDRVDTNLGKVGVGSWNGTALLNPAAGSSEEKAILEIQKLFFINHPIDIPVP